MKMNFNKIFYIPLILILAFSSCNESEDLITADAETGGLLHVTNNSLNYVVGYPEGPYRVEALVNQGKVKTQTINVYRSFTRTVPYTIIVIEDDEEVEKDTSKTFFSNEVLDQTIDITEGVNHHISFEYTLDELIEGLSISNL